jgi:hypothetical protein
MAIGKTSLNISERAKQRLAALSKETGLSQSQILDALLSQTAAIEIVVRWIDPSDIKKPTAKPAKKNA